MNPYSCRFVCCRGHGGIFNIPMGGRCSATGTTNSSSSHTLCVLLASSRVTSKATRTGKSMCKSLLHNLLLQQRARAAAGCGLNENKPKPSRRFICNPSPGYSWQNNTTETIKTLVFVPWKSIGLRFVMVQRNCKYKLDWKEEQLGSSSLWDHCN